MCGIYGFVEKGNRNLSLDDVVRMGNIISYRGPDDGDFYFNDGICLGNKRLSIIDVEGGKQPFYSDDNDIVVVQNGEIFNHVELAHELKGTKFECRTKSDTEVLLRLYEKFGINFLHKLNGMFAIAIYDIKKKTLFLARDHVGEKPLYFYNDGNKFIFASEIKSILSCKVKKEMNHQALDAYLSFNYVPPPITMFNNIEHVMPGTYMEINENGTKKKKWWSLSNINEIQKSEDFWINSFNDIFEDAVDIRLRSDVDFGAFLSGGIDSSSVVGIMSKKLQRPVKAFSIGFDDKRFDESRFSSFAAEKFGADLKLEIVESNLLNLWPKSLYHCDQPHGDVSFMPTLKLSEMAAKEVKMVLTGDGGDELFAGYDKYKNFFMNGNNIDSSDSDFSKNYMNNISLFVKEEREKLYSDHFYHQVDLDYSKNYIEQILNESKNFDRINQALYIDLLLLLPGNNLVKPDRMGMAASIENRSPFLDHRLIELAFNIPGKLKLKNNETKYILKKSILDLIGPELTYRKKQMFTVPISDWLKNDLRDTVNDLLYSRKSISRELFNLDYIKNLYDEHCKDIKNNTREIRALMALEIWFRQFIDNEPNILTLNLTS